jgi:hypothetical protein
MGFASPKMQIGSEGDQLSTAKGKCPRSRLFVQVESPPLEVSEPYGVFVTDRRRMRGLSWAGRGDQR